MTVFQLIDNEGKVRLKAETTSTWSQAAPVHYTGETELLMKAPQNLAALFLTSLFTEAAERHGMKHTNNALEPRFNLVSA
jgi:hypothetical protein